ncbi:transcription factor IBH1-like isoform X1 [Juglans microcarpa x Juglans regia]|uniref:transcription factor IBH1-like isoform X1 n=1 Tax=Juglans microcarpa x Juglans regia TaxID=2249226 RepID=UPI001B7E4E44|nr:transcription factor IBH1-like isoform X1 [Juglans microcarpa x Juglans regia]
MNPKRFSSSTWPSTTVKSRFTCGFLRALWRINRQRRTTSASSREIRRRYLRVKVAADVSMASAVGSRRAWSRAILLRKIRNQGQNGTVRVRRMSNILGMMRKRNIRGNYKCTEEVGTCQAEQLRKLVPGGEEMDMCNLLGETAHYIECLTTQMLQKFVCNEQ